MRLECRSKTLNEWFHITNYKYKQFSHRSWLRIPSIRQMLWVLTPSMRRFCKLKQTSRMVIKLMIWLHLLWKRDTSFFKEKTNQIYWKYMKWIYSDLFNNYYFENTVIKGLGSRLVFFSVYPINSKIFNLVSFVFRS